MQMKVIIIYNNGFLVSKMEHGDAHHFASSSFNCICGDVACWIGHRDWWCIGLLYFGTFYDAVFGVIGGGDGVWMNYYPQQSVMPKVMKPFTGW